MNEPWRGSHSHSHTDNDSDADHAGIAITGIGVLTPLGDTLPALMEALHGGRRSLTPAAEPSLAAAGVVDSRIVDFDATRYANFRGMRIYNRTTRLGISAAKLALTDAGLELGAVPSELLGLTMGSTFGHLDTLMEYDRSLASDGIQRTNPALMPLGLPSAPGAAIALSFAAKAFSITVGTDAASSLDALALGARLIAAGRARVCLVVGAFAPFLELSLAALRAGLLTGEGEPRVFDRRHAGTAFGEAAAAVVIERRDDARLRGAAAKGIIGGHASTFDANGETGAERALHRACTLAMATARVQPAAIGLVSAGANGSPAMDDAEARALALTLPGPGAGRPAGVPVTAPKANLGEVLDAGGLVQLAVALGALSSGAVPAIPGLEEPAVPGLHYASGSADVTGRHALVTSISSTGSCAALVVSGPNAD